MIHFVTQEHYDRLVDNVINDSQPPVQMSCDWLGHVLDPAIYPLKVYRVIQELKHANSNSSQR